jgi:hypothetical protein
MKFIVLMGLLKLFIGCVLLSRTVSGADIDKMTVFLDLMC